MNNLFLKFLKKDTLNFIQNATEEDCNLILPNGFSSGFFDWIKSLRDKGSDPIQFIAQFPERATRLPAVCCVLGNINTSLDIQTESYETEELTDSEYTKYRHLAASIEGEKVSYIQSKSFISTSQVVLGCYSNNKIEVSWLMFMMDFFVHFRAEDLSVIGVMDVGTQETDLRLRQELFPLAVPTRILTVNFKYETIIPRVERTKAYFGGDLEFKLSADISSDFTGIKLSQEQ